LSNPSPCSKLSFGFQSNADMKLHFSKADSNEFSQDLLGLSSRYNRRYRIRQKAHDFLWVKLLCYSVVFIGAYVALIMDPNISWYRLTIHYVLLGLSGMLLAFNTAHDAAHSCFSSNRGVNRLIFNVTFHLQGFSGYLWRMRHLASHHLFPNVDGCDADIDDNPILCLSPHHKKKWFHRYQHFYATALYMVYTLHWLFIKDFQYLNKKEFANLKNQKHRPKAILQLITWKVFYLVYMILVPHYLLYCPLYRILCAFLMMHLIVSICFVWTLIISHFCEATEFPVADQNGLLPYDYHRHQLEVSMDYHPRNHLVNFLLGGFNAHAAHHLFPRLPHTCYPYYSKVIDKIARKHEYPYHELPMHRAIRSHYQYLKRLGQTG